MMTVEASTFTTAICDVLSDCVGKFRVSLSKPGPCGPVTNVPDVLLKGWIQLEHLISLTDRIIIGNDKNTVR